MSDFENKSALVLTEDEWKRLEEICEHYLAATPWSERETNEDAKVVRARRRVAQRIVEACE